MNYVWSFFIILSLIFSLTNNSQSIFSSINSSIHNSLLLCFQLSCVYIFWCAILEIFEDSGLGNMLSKKLKVFLHKIFPNLDDKTYSSISTSLTCSFLGFGNVSVPSTLKAIDYHNKLRPNESSFSITLFILLNCINIQLFSTTPLSIYVLNGGADIFFVWFIGFCVSIFCILLCFSLLKLYFKLKKK
jgi:spore maturation protein SpmA